MIKVQSQEHMKKESSLTDIYLKDLDRFKRDHDTFVTAILCLKFVMAIKHI